MPENNARLTLRLSPVTSNRDPGHYMALVIEDAISGLRVASFELMGEHLLDLLSGRQVGSVEGVPAYLIERENRGALGCHSFLTQHHFPMGRYNDDTVERWAASTSRALDAAEHRVKKNNAGQIVVTFVYYTTATLPAQVEALREERQATMDVAATACAADK